MAVPFSKVRLWPAVLTICACVCADVGTAVAQDDAVTRANRMAYDSAIKCFIANGIVAGDWRRDGDKAKQAVFEAKARESFDIATKAGDVLGYSGTRINQDFGLAQSEDMPRMMTDNAYFKSTVAMCKSLGLM